MQNACTEEELQLLLDTEEYDFRFNLGIVGCHLGEVGHIVSVIAKQYAILNVKAELDQMLCGMADTLNVLEMVREHPQMRSLFVFSKRPPLTADNLYDLVPALYSPRGSNQRDKEEAIIMQWIAFTNFVEGKRLNTTYPNSLIIQTLFLKYWCALNRISLFLYIIISHDYTQTFCIPKLVLVQH